MSNSPQQLVVQYRQGTAQDYQTSRLAYSVLRVASQLVLGGITNQTLAFLSEGNIAGGNTVSLVVGDNLNTAVLEHTNAARQQFVRSTKASRVVAHCPHNHYGSSAISLCSVDRAQVDVINTIRCSRRHASYQE